MKPTDDSDMKLQCNPSTRTVLLILTETILTIPVLMMLWWVFEFLGGVSLDSDNENEFNWHPIAMLIGMFFLFGNAVIAYRLFPFNRRTNKWIHAVLHLLASGFIIFGLYAVIKSKVDFGYAQFYSLHSWVGIITSLTYIIWTLFSTGVFQDIDSRKFSWLRRWYLPIHIVGGVFLLLGAFISIETGILEFALFRVFYGELLYDEYTTESWVINVMCLAILVALLFLIYVLYTIPRILVVPRKATTKGPSDKEPILGKETTTAELGEAGPAVQPETRTEKQEVAYESLTEVSTSSGVN